MAGVAKGNAKEGHIHSSLGDSDSTLSSTVNVNAFAWLTVSYSEPWRLKLTDFQPFEHKILKFKSASE